MLCVVDAVAQDADKPSDQLLGSLGVCRDKIADIVQRIINKVGIDLRLKILHLHPVVHFGKSDVALAQLLNAANHLVDLTGDLLDLIAGVDLDDAELTKLAAELKKKCGCGGAVKDGVIEIQGDKRDLLKSLLEAKGMKVKLAGG